MSGEDAAAPTARGRTGLRNRLFGRLPRQTERHALAGPMIACAAPAVSPFEQLQKGRARFTLQFDVTKKSRPIAEEPSKVRVVDRKTIHVRNAVKDCGAGAVGMDSS